MAQDFQDLVVWQRAMEMIEALYRLTKTFPADEVYGLTSQLRRAGVSVASNIAEGRGRGSDGEFKRFLNFAQGSVFEVQTQLLVAKRLKMGDGELREKAEALCIETSKMLRAILKTIEG